MVRWPMARFRDVVQVNPRRDRRLRLLDDDMEVTFVPMSAVDARTGKIAITKVRVLSPDYSSRKHKMSKRVRHVESDQRVAGYPQKKAEPPFG